MKSVEIPARPMRGRICALCGRSGGQGLTKALQALGIDTQAGANRYAHSSCIATRKRKLGLTTSTMRHVPVAQRTPIAEDERAD